jgi:hypothetical protein
MSDFQHTAATAHAVAEPTRATPRRKAPKTDEQLLAEAEKRSGVLRAKMIANRDRQRMELVDDLYAKYSVEAVAEDRSERKRLATLRGKLGL